MATLLDFQVLKFVAVPQPCMDFHQIFRICLLQEDLQLIRFWGYLVATVAMAALLKFSGLKVCSQIFNVF